MEQAGIWFTCKNTDIFNRMNSPVTVRDQNCRKPDHENESYNNLPTNTFSEKQQQQKRYERLDKIRKQKAAIPIKSLSR